MSLRVLYLHQHFTTPDGAGGTRSWAMARALAGRGHRVTMACGLSEGTESGLSAPFRRGRRTGRAGPLRVAQFAVPYANAMGPVARSRAFLCFAARSTALAVGGGFDVIVASSTPPTVALPALAALGIAGVPFVFEIRDPWPDLLLSMGALRPGLIATGLSALTGRACRGAAGVIALSEGAAASARRHGARRVALIPNGCDLDLFGPHVAPVRPAVAAPSEVVFVYAGAHGPANGLDTLLDAAAILRGRDERRVRLLLVGDGADRARLIGRAQADGLHNVTFAPAMPKRALAALLAGVQGGLLCLAPVPAFAEGTSPNKLMDLLAAGLPVVSNVPGRAARWLAEGEAGLTATTATGLADAMAVLARDPARRAAMGQAARRLAVRRFDRRVLAAQFCAVVEAAARPLPVPHPRAHHGLDPDAA